MYSFRYLDSTYIEFFPIIEDFKIIRERDIDNPFIIRTSAQGKLSVKDSAFTYFESFKGTSNEIDGYFSETITGEGTAQYLCKYTVSNEINYSTKILSISVTITDNYFNLLDNPEKNINTEFDIRALNIPIQKITKTGFTFWGAKLKDIITKIVGELDVAVVIDSTTFDFFDNNNYLYPFICQVKDNNKSTFSGLSDLFQIKLSTVLEFLSVNSGMQTYFYLDSSNNLRFGNINDLAFSAYSLDLTNFNGKNWAEQTPDLVQFEEKLSFIQYVNNNLKSYFKNVSCVFSKNKKNEIINTYDFITDLDQSENETSGLSIINTNKTTDNRNINDFLNVSLDTFTSSGAGTSLVGTNSGGGIQYAEQNILDQFALVQDSALELSWTSNTPSPNGLVEIADSSTGTIYASFPVDNESGVFIPSSNLTVRCRITQSNVGSFDIDNLILDRVSYLIRSSTIDTILVWNNEFAPQHIISNFGGNYPNSEGIINDISETGLSTKPSEVEEIEFAFTGLLNTFVFSDYIKTNISEKMIPYRIERNVLGLDGKGFDNLILKKYDNAVVPFDYFTFTGSNFEEVTDTNILNPMSGITNGVIEFEYRTTSTTKQGVFSITNTLGGGINNFADININEGVGEPIRFAAAFDNDLLFNVNSLADNYFQDGEWHTVKCIIDGNNNRFIIDGNTYQDTQLTFTTGDKTTSKFFPLNNNFLNLGRRKVWGVAQVLEQAYCTGDMRNFKITNVAETVTYYEFY